MHYLVRLLEILILVNPKPDEPSLSVIVEKSVVDSLKEAGVFQALQEKILICRGASSCIVYMNGSFKVDMASCFAPSLRLSPLPVGLSHPL